MARKRLDAVIEAVHYLAGGNISIVRAYERHGVVWSDHILLSRNELSERLLQGKCVVVGKRKTYLGSVFETGAAVHLLEGNIVTVEQSTAGDLLTGVPVF
jgi:hypothetical protein